MGVARTVDDGALSAHALRQALPYRVFIVDDHPVFSRGLSHLVNEDARLELAGTARDATEALDWLRSNRTDVVVVDISLAGANGLDLVKTIRGEDPATQVVVISMHDESLYGERALRAGAAGYVMKHEDGDKMLEAIHAVGTGEMWVSPALAARMLRKAADGPRSGSGSPLHALSDRELVIFELIGLGRTTDEISRALHISKKTVESHRHNIRGKLKLKSGLDLVRHAMQWSHEAPLRPAP